MKKKRPTCIDLFCGCGGFSLGFINAGFDVLLGLDFDHAALTTYAYNLGADNMRWVGELPKKRFQTDCWNGLSRPPLYGEDPCSGKGKAPNWALKDLRKKRNHLPWKRTVKIVVCKDIQDDTSTKWFAQLRELELSGDAELRFIQGRVRFLEVEDGTPGPNPMMGALVAILQPRRDLCDGCKHKHGRYFGRCIHCSRNPKATEDYYEAETDP